jgi:hypothetical protein
MSDDSRARLSELKEGDMVEVDSSFDCLEAWSKHEVKRYGGGLYIECSHGHHYLEAQHDPFSGTLVGIYKLPSQVAQRD